MPEMIVCTGDRGDAAVRRAARQKAAFLKWRIDDG
jgi:hypothetical protein